MRGRHASAGGTIPGSRTSAAVSSRSGEAGMFGNLGFGELMVILVIVLVLFGAKRVPEISASFGKGIREFKRNLNDIEQSVTTAVTSPPQVQEPQRQAWAPLPPRDAAEETAEAQAREPKRLL